MLNKIKSVVLLVVALGVMYSPAAQAGEWLVVRAAEACSGMRAGDQSPTPAFDNNAVLQSDPDDAQRFWCRIEVPNDKYISDANVYGT
ncbi:MAG: hypothetical protein QGG89_17020, partial [Vicinamibacterales bacterium]|nr:hypothetical protein [Vicinamibacterales bacterium]